VTINGDAAAHWSLLISVGWPVMAANASVAESAGYEELCPTGQLAVAWLVVTDGKCSPSASMSLLQK
jgi:hypothetical protein